MAPQTVIVSVALADALDLSGLPPPDALHAGLALGEVQFTGEAVQCGVAHARSLHQSRVLFFREPLAQPFPLLVGEHVSVGVAFLLFGQCARERVYFHLTEIIIIIIIHLIVM